MKNNWSHIHTPQLIVDETRVRRNLKRMISKASGLNKELRPHFKTHQSQTIGRWCREEGIRKITVSSLGMAEYFAADGWDDITIAFPCNLRQADRINALAEKIDLTLLTDHPEVAKEINRKIMHKVGVFIEIDAGSNRTGVHFDDAEKLNMIYGELKAGMHDVAGIYTHSGHTYACRAADDVVQTGREAISRMERASSLIEGNIDAVCFGDT
ncbi:MAG: alanine racemase, partial [Cyclobacteriaceae bacterium]